MEFSIENLLASLPIMGKGMFGIFIVTAVIILVVMALNYTTSPKTDKKKEDKQ